jgi:hypothetical protein
LDLAFGIAAAVDGVLLRVFTGIAVAERMLALGSTFVLMLAVAAGVAGPVDAADTAGAAGSVEVGVAGAVDAADKAGAVGSVEVGVAGAVDAADTAGAVGSVEVGAAGAVDAADAAGAAGSVEVGAARSVDVGVTEGAAGAGKSASFGGGIAMAIAPLFSGTANEVEFSVKAAM